VFEPRVLMRVKREGKEEKRGFERFGQE